MPITNHVTSLELSRRLKELGVPQTSHFVWFNNSGITGDAFWTFGYKEEIIDNGVTLYPEKTISAYLASELGEMLPDIITGEHLYSYQQARNWSDKRLPKHRLVYWFAGEIELYRVDADTEADARSKILIYLIENHLISVEELGK